MLTLSAKVVPSLFHKNSNSPRIFQTMFLFATVLPLVRVSVILDPYFGGVRALKPPKKGHFVDAEYGRQNFQNL